MARNKAVFLDRDGTINQEVEYLRDIKDLVLIEGAAQGIKLLNEHGFKVVVVTNQSGVARGFFDENFVDMIHQEISRRLTLCGARVDRWYYCPHHPTCGRGDYRRDCLCRKPSIGMMQDAARDLDIDLASSYVIGDSARDIEMALNAGSKPVLVRTGYGSETLLDMPEEMAQGLEYVARDLLDACSWICRSL